MRSLLIVVTLVPAFAQTSPIPASIADSVGSSLNLVEGQLLSIAEAMPESKYSFIPSGGNFAGVRSFGQQVKHAACAQFAFFNEIEGKTSPAECEKGGPSKAATQRNLSLSDHYGQMVVYLRMNGIVPPASQSYGLRVR
jgi:hypothetical protein